MGNDFLNNYGKDLEKDSEIKSAKNVTHKPRKKREPKNVSKKNVSKKQVPLIPIVSGVVGILVIVIIMFFVFAQNIVLPDMVNWTLTDANNWVTENKILVRVTEEFNDDIEANTVISQNPEAGEELEKEGYLELVISKGPDLSIMVTIPDFMTMTKQEIEAWGEENHMSKLRITTENSQTVEEGKVLTFTVNDSTVLGKEVRRDSPIYVIISNGSGENGSVTLPDFTTMTLDMANTFALDNKIILEITEVFDESIPKGQVISQDIKLDEVIKSGETVKLKVSKGREIIIPNFSSYPIEAASALASQQGINVVTKEVYSHSSKGKLISQSLKAGSLYNELDVLTLTYSLGNRIVIPSFVDEGVDALHAWVADYNEQGTKYKVQVTYTSSDKSPGLILTQDKANTSYGIEETIKVLVSEGKVVYVPDFVGEVGANYSDIITREDAIQMCNDAGLVAIFVEENKTNRLPGEVWSQSIAAGKEVQQGTTITLKYTSVNNAVVVPNFVGMTQEQILQSGYGQVFTLVFAGTDPTEVVSVQSIAAGTTVAPSTVIQLGADINLDDENAEEDPI